MTLCHQLSDRMPEVTRGRERWTADEERHLARCESCRLEWDLVRRVARVGNEVERRVDSAAVADRVLPRLRTADVTVSRRRVWLVGALAAAASLAVLLWGKSSISTPRSMAVARESVTVTPAARPAATSQLRLPVPELDGLSAEQLRMVMDSLDRPFRPDQLLESPGWGDLESRDLEAGFSS